MIVIFAMLLRLVELSDLIDAFRQLRVPYFIVLTCIHLFVLFIYSPLVWRSILGQLGCHPPIKAIYQIWIGISCLRAVLPMKSGGVVGANYLRLTENLPLTRGIGSLVLLHFLNFYSLWVYLTIGLWLTDKGGWKLPLALTLLLVSVPITLPWLSVLTKIGQRFHPRLGAVLGNLIGGFTEIPLFPRLLLFAIVLFFQCLDLLIVGLGLRGVGIIVPLSDLFLRVPMVYLIANLPLTLMGMGTREATMVIVFSQFSSQASILAAGIGLSFCMEIVPPLLSLAYLPKALSMGLFSPQLEKGQS